MVQGTDEVRPHRCQPAVNGTEVKVFLWGVATPNAEREPKDLDFCGVSATRPRSRVSTKLIQGQPVMKKG